MSERSRTSGMGSRLQGAPARRHLEQHSQRQSAVPSSFSGIPPGSQVPRRMKASPVRQASTAQPSNRRHRRSSSVDYLPTSGQSFAPPQTQVQVIPPARPQPLGRRRTSSMLVMHDDSDEDIVGHSILITEGAGVNVRHSSPLQVHRWSRRRSSRSPTLNTPPQRDELLEMPFEDRRDFWSNRPSVEVPPRRRRCKQLRVFKEKLIVSLWPARLLLMCLGCMAVAIIYGLKLNMVSSLDVMVNHTAVDIPGKTGSFKGLFTCPEYKEIIKDGPFLWDEVTQGMLMNGYLYGYMGSHIPGAILAERFGGKWVTFAAVVFSGLCCVLTPSTANNAQWDMLLLLLMVQGAAGGFVLPAITTLITHWAPPHLRSVFCGIMFGGFGLGKVAAVLMAYLTLERSWEFRFHFLVLVILPWAVLWGLWIHSSPVDSIFISVRRGDRHGTSTTEPYRDPGIKQFPLLAIKNSMAFWALVVANFGGGCGFYMLMTQIPRFVKQVQRLKLEENIGFYVLPYILMFLVSVSSGILIDYLRNTRNVSLQMSRKIAASVAMVIPAGCIIGMSLSDCNSLTGIILFMVAVACVGCDAVSYLANHIDVSPNFASLLIGITNIFATVPQVIIPTILSYSPLEREVPNKSFYVIAAIYITSFFFFAMFASANVQPWNAGVKT